MKAGTQQTTRFRVVRFRGLEFRVEEKVSPIPTPVASSSCYTHESCPMLLPPNILSPTACKSLHPEHP